MTFCTILEKNTSQQYQNGQILLIILRCFKVFAHSDTVGLYFSLKLYKRSYVSCPIIDTLNCLSSHFLNIQSRLLEVRGFFKPSYNLYYYRGVVRKAFTYASLRKERLMTTEELEFLKNLPDKVTIYRGMTVEESTKEHQGVSWTLDKKVAEFFAYQYIRNQSTAKKPKTVVEKVIDKSEIICNSQDLF